VHEENIFGNPLLNTLPRFRKSGNLQLHQNRKLHTSTNRVVIHKNKSQVQNLAKNFLNLFGKNLLQTPIFYGRQISVISYLFPFFISKTIK